LGSKYTLADLIWTPLLARLPLLPYFRGFSLPSPPKDGAEGPNFTAFFKWMDVCLARPSFAENRTPWLALLSSVQPRGTHPFHALTLSYLHTRLTDATYADEVGCERSPSSYFLLYTPPGLPLLSFLAHSRNLYLLLYMLFSCMVPVRNY